MSTNDINHVAGTSGSSFPQPDPAVEGAKQIFQVLSVIQAIVDLEPGKYLESNLSKPGSSAVNNASMFDLEPTFQVSDLHKFKCKFKHMINNDLFSRNMDQIASQVASNINSLNEKKTDPELSGIIKTHSVWMNNISTKFEENFTQIKNRLGFLETDRPVQCQESKKLFSKGDSRTFERFLHIYSMVHDLFFDVPQPTKPVEEPPAAPIITQPTPPISPASSINPSFVINPHSVKLRAAPVTQNQQVPSSQPVDLFTRVKDLTDHLDEISRSVGSSDDEWNESHNDEHYDSQKAEASRVSVLYSETARDQALSQLSSKESDKILNQVKHLQKEDAERERRAKSAAFQSQARQSNALFRNLADQLASKPDQRPVVRTHAVADFTDHTKD